MLTLRPFQKDALEALQRPGHVVCVAPTGAGKSLIYERAALQPGRRTLLVTPLTALGRQQHVGLSRLNHAAFTTRLGTGAPSEGPPPGRESGIWIVSPEKLRSPGGQAQLKRWAPDFLVVDECHCLWEWGESFRPAFARLPEMLGELGISRSLWLTATLPPEARTDLLRQLRARGPVTELGVFGLPPRLELGVVRVPWVDRAEAMLGWLRQQREPGILFVPTREAAARLARLIEAAGIEALAYHAGFSSEERRALEARIFRELPAVIVATSAFGMGMDCPRLQWCMLWQAPSSLLALAQAIGRAGRDPERGGRALVLWDFEDFRLLEWSLAGSPRRVRQLMEVRNYLMHASCRKAALSDYFAGRGVVTGTAGAGADAAGEAAGTRAGAASCGTCDFCVAAALDGATTRTVVAV